jgi:hypothetical protein
MNSKIVLLHIIDLIGQVYIFEITSGTSFNGVNTQNSKKQNALLSTKVYHRTLSLKIIIMVLFLLFSSFTLYLYIGYYIKGSQN